ncbi:MAG: ABC transporter permease [Synergistaceae bacterium]|jgi:simple sugar transport system permease protein|nr:ABC transporter permease [Synergistaceae bacterium]
MNKILSKNEFWLFCILLILSCIVGGINDAFWSGTNLFSLFKSSVVMGIFALGVLIVILSGGIDISFPAFAVFSFYITVKYLLYIKFTGSILIPFAMAMAIGVALGLMNAFIISTFKLNPLIVTLGTGSAVTGFLRAFVGTGTLSNLPQPLIDFSRWNIYTETLADGSVIGFSGSFLILAALIVIMALILRNTTMGRGVYALGCDSVAAMRAGFPVRGIYYFIYGLVGALAGIAGIVHCSLIRLANPRDLEGTELEVIAAVVLGGASLTGGRGTVLGTVLGVFLIVLIKGSLILVGIPSDWQKVAIGLVLISATSITAYRAMRAGM